MKRAELDAVLISMLESHPGISDINFSAGRPPQVEAFGALKGVDLNPPVKKLTSYQTESIALNIIGAEGRLLDDLADKGSCDCAWTEQAEADQ